MSEKHGIAQPVGIASFAMDSGAHSLYTKRVMKEKTGKLGRGDYSFYESDVFWQYVNEYCDFIEKNSDVIDWYVNVDVIFEPRLTWKVQRYMEDERGLSPLPVIHYGADLKVLKRYLKYGYDFIGVGGLGQEVSSTAYYIWADQIFDCLCSNLSRLPCVRIHGFAMTGLDLLKRYPWWSVDSATWVKVGAWGTIFVPRRIRGRWDFLQAPHRITVSDVPTTERTNKGMHYKKLSPNEQRLTMSWLEEIDIPMGSGDELGVSNFHVARKSANLKYYKQVEEALPEWPWAYRPAGRGGRLF